MSVETTMRLAIALFAFVFTVAASPIQEVLRCGRPGSAGGLAAGTDMERFTINTARFPEAVCNDGSPAVFYFAPGTEPTKWVIFLQGGGACRSGQACAERWCSVDTNFGMDKMTSALTKASIRIDGLLDPGAQNRFATWNRVLLFYCSSDGWTGTKTATLAAAGASGATVEYEIPFKGARIIDAVLDTLRKDFGKRRAVGAPGKPLPWPDLDSATHVLFAGSSAGGGGATNNADRVGAKLRATNPGLAEYRVLIDASHEPDYSQTDFAGSRLCDVDPVGCSYQTYFEYHWTEAFIGLSGSSGDASCIAYHRDDAWRCADGGHVLLHHVTAPWFLRMDLQDSLISENYAENGFGTRVEFGARLEAELRALPAAEEPRGATPGLFVPQCTDHESVTNGRPVFNVFVQGLNFHDAVWNWWTGAQPRQAIRNFTGRAGAAADCP